MNVMLGISSLTESEVLIGGISVKKIGIRILCCFILGVQQDNVLFAISIADNQGA